MFFIYTLLYFSIPSFISDYFIYKLIGKNLKISNTLKMVLFIIFHIIFVSLLFILSIFYIAHCVRDS